MYAAGQAQPISLLTMLTNNRSASRIRRRPMVSRKLSFSVPERGSDGWQLEYEFALPETDRKILFKGVEIAEAAILTRREALSHSPDGFVEGQEIKIALDTLSKLKKEGLKFL
jgi:hypothetical protein